MTMRILQEVKDGGSLPGQEESQKELKYIENSSINNVVDQVWFYILMFWLNIMEVRCHVFQIQSIKEQEEKEKEKEKQKTRKTSSKRGDLSHLSIPIQEN